MKWFQNEVKDETLIYQVTTYSVTRSKQARSDSKTSGNKFWMLNIKMDEIILEMDIFKKGKKWIRNQQLP